MIVNNFELKIDHLINVVQNLDLKYAVRIHQSKYKT